MLPTHYGDAPPSALPAKEVSKVALRLKYQVEQVVSCEVEESAITSANSAVITNDVVNTSKEAGGEEYRSCIVFCLLVCIRWFQSQALVELWDADLHYQRAVACEVIAKRM